MSMRSSITSSGSERTRRGVVGLLSLWSTSRRRIVSEQRKLKDGALGFVRSNPQPAIVGLDDRTADRQTHPHATRFCREEWIEYPLEILRGDSSSGVRHRYDNAAAVVDLGFHAQDPRFILGRHRIDGVRDQVEEHLSQLDSISYYLRQQFIRLGSDQYPVLLQVDARQGKGFPDEVVNVERSSRPGLHLEDRPNASDHRSRAMASSGDLLECRLRFIEIGRRAIKPAQARIGAHYHPRQWLLDLVSNRGRDCVPGHQPRLTFATLRQDGAEQLRVKRRYLIQQDTEYKNAGHEP